MLFGIFHAGFAFMTTAYDTDLDRNAANFVALSPLSFIARTAAVYPQRLAIIHGSRRQTWCQTYARCRQLASALQHWGIRRGDTVAVMMGSTLDFIRVWLGLQYRGAVGVLLNTELSGAFLAHQLANCGCAFAIADATLAPRVVAAAPQAPAGGGHLRRALPP